MDTFKVRLRHDGGHVDITTTASDADAASSQVLAAEGAPRRAVVSVRQSSAARALTIHDGTRDGLLEIMDTSWDGNGTLSVTVREKIGGGDAGWIGGMPIERMRRLARRALPYPEKTRSSRVVRRFIADGCGYVTFAVSRLPR